ncbi:hypothetical protein C0J52_22241 [Blattella germanica]|nr:hypothetical protein C0J52_22241 [Blattella germanica]PSN35570.1 hypothetical protein C0J52_22241 [Blattella germanica]
MKKIAPAAFSGLEELQRLYLYNNKLQYLHASAFNNNLKLKTLDLSGNLFTELTPGLFQENHHLYFVNLTGNYILFSSVSADIYNETLNLMRIEFCKEPEPYISFLQNSTPTIGEFGQKRKLLLSQARYSEAIYQNLTGLNITIQRSDLPFHSGTMKTDTSRVCFCDQYLVWFWCNENDFNCKKSMDIIDMYSFLGCRLNFEKSNISSSYNAKSDTLHNTVDSTDTIGIKQYYFTKPITHRPIGQTVQNKYSDNMITSTSNNDISDTTSSEDFWSFSSNWYLYVGIGAGLVTLIGAIIGVIIWRRQRRNRIPDYQGGQHIPGIGLHLFVNNLLKNQNQRNH